MNGADDFGEDADTQVEEPPLERRTEPRVAASLRVRFRTLNDLVTAYTRDISRGGAFVATSHLLPIGSVVRLTLELPDEGGTVAVLARVAFHRDGDEGTGGMGMEFVEVHGPTIEEQIEGYLALQLGEPDAPELPIGAHVLVVEDDPTYRRVLGGMLSRAGCRVSLATNGLEALGLAMREPFEVVVSDIEMPIMDGWKLLHLVRARPNTAHIPFVLLTGRDDESHRLRGYRLGADDYICKPVRREEVAARIARVLARARAHPRTTASKNALRGDLGQVSLSSVLQFIDLERRSGFLLLVSGDDLATLHIAGGSVRQVELPARYDDVTGLDRLLVVLDWQEGWFELSSGEVDVPDSIGVPTSHALLEHARRADESGRGD